MIADFSRRWGLALVFCFPFPTLAQAPVWSQFPGSPGGTSPRNDDIYFVSPTNGWSARATDGIYRTTNGATFTRVLGPSIAYPGANLLPHFRSIGFASATRGWAGNLGPGSYDGSVTDTNMLYETFDGGVSWNPVPAINESGSKGFCAIHVLDSQHIYGGGRVRGPAYFAKTEDGGTTWSVTNLTAAGVMGGIMDVYFHDPLNGFLVGMNTNAYTTSCSGYRGTIARTSDGGLTWTNVVTTPVTCSYFWKMSWPSAAVGYASLQQNGAHNAVIFYKTTDGGVSWSSNGIPFAALGVSSFFLQGIGFVNENEGWMGGSGTVAAPFNFIHTTDGGSKWTVAGYDNTQSINRIRFLDSTFGYASGRKLHVFRIPLAITTPPTNLTVTVGADATFTVGAAGTAPLAYQWRLHGTNLPGANAPTCTITNAQLTDSGPYDVVVSNYSGAITSAVALLTVNEPATAPEITTHPQSLLVNPGINATFSVTALGTAPLQYQWRFHGTNLAGATQSSYTRTNAQPVHAGEYSVVVSNSAGSVTSAVATLAFPFEFYDDFEGFPPTEIKLPGAFGGYTLFFDAVSGPLDFTAIFGFDYSTVTSPAVIPPAPHSASNATRGLLLSVNKDTTGSPTVVNLYPAGPTFGGNFALKFDLWLNWSDLSVSTEHALFGILHSGAVTNRVAHPGSDGVFFALSADGGVSATTGAIRDYAVFRGAGSAAPVLMTTNNTVFGPTPPLGARFDNSDPVIEGLFPPRAIPGWGNTPAGSAGLQWLSVEVRCLNDLVTWLLNGTTVAQFTNPAHTGEGTVMLGYYDHFASASTPDSFAIFDNVRVESLTVTPVRLLSPRVVGSDFAFDFASEPYELYTIQWATNLGAPVWTTLTNLVGNGLTNEVSLPWQPDEGAENYFRVSRP